MAAGLMGRIGKLEETFGTEDEPRRIIVWAADSWLSESWIETKHGIVNFHVRTPGRGSDAMDHLTPKMRAMMRTGDIVTVFEIGENRRNCHLQQHKPPWKRHPYRLISEGKGDYELEVDGRWVAYVEGVWS